MANFPSQGSNILEEKDDEGPLVLPPRAASPPLQIVDNLAELEIETLLREYRYARTSRTFFLEERTCEFDPTYYSDEDNNTQKFVYLPDVNVAPRVLVNSYQLNMSCFLSFCERYDIYLEGIPNLIMPGKHPLKVRHHTTLKTKAPLCLPSYLFVFSCAVCRFCKDNTVTFRDKNEFRGHEAEFQGAAQLRLLQNYQFLTGPGGVKGVSILRIRDLNRYSDFLKKDDLNDRTEDSQLLFDPLEFGWLLFKIGFNPSLITDETSLDPWTECVSLVMDQQVPVTAEPGDYEDSLRNFRTETGGFTVLTRDDLALVVQANQFIYSNEQRNHLLDDLYVVVPQGTTRDPLPCREIPDPRVNFKDQDSFGVYVSEKQRGSFRSIEEYFVGLFTSLNEEQLRSPTIRSFLQFHDNDPVRKEILSRNWPTAKLLSLDCVTLLEKSLCFDFKVLRANETIQVPPNGCFVYGGDRTLESNEQVLLRLCNSLRVPKPEPNELVFCFSTIDQLMKFVRYLFFLAIEYDVFLPLTPFLKDIYETYGLFRHFLLPQAKEISSYWIPRLERRVQVLNTYSKLYSLAPVRRLPVFSLPVVEEETKRLNDVVKKTKAEINLLVASSKTSDPSKSKSQIEGLKSRLKNAIESLEAQGSVVEAARPVSDPFRGLHESFNRQGTSTPRNVVSFTGDDGDGGGGGHLFESVTKKLKESQDRMSSSLFDRVVQADEAPLITNAIEEKKEISLKEKFRKMRGPIQRFMSVVAGSLPNTKLDALYIDYPEDVTSFESHYECFSEACHKVMAELNQTIIRVTSRELTLKTMFTRHGLDNFREVASELASVFLLRNMGKSATSYKSMYNQTSVVDLIQEIKGHLALCWREAN